MKALGWFEERRHLGSWAERGVWGCIWHLAQGCSDQGDFYCSSGRGKGAVWSGGWQTFSKGHIINKVYRSHPASVAYFSPPPLPLKHVKAILGIWAAQKHAADPIPYGMACQPLSSAI